MARRVLLFAMLACLWPPATAAQAASDLTFLHLSDPHVPHALAQSRATVAALPTSGPIALRPCNITVPGPSFAIVTGDLNEYGGGAGDWARYLALWTGLPFPVYHELGNHDNTWDCGRPRLRALYGSPFYAFEHSGIKFIGWDSATPQDPRPSVATEGLAWLRGEFERTPPEQPVIFFLHHAPEGTEFAGPYETRRLLDVLSTRNVALLLVGHGHGARAWKVDGFDVVMGGSTFGDNAGYGIVSIKDNIIRVCHQYVAPGREMVLLLEKPLPSRSPFLEVRSVSPADGHVFRASEPLRWIMHLSTPDAVRAARWQMDGESSGHMERQGEDWVATIPRERVSPGAHWIGLELEDAEGVVTRRAVGFWREGEDVRILWKHHLAGSCQSTPTLHRGTLYIGSNDGALNAVDAATGQCRWRVVTGGEVRSHPAILPTEAIICFGSADGTVRAVSTDGDERWRRDLGSPIYSSPLVVGNQVLFGTNGGEVLALEAATGGVMWRSSVAGYSIESGLSAGEGLIYAGAWDRFLYAVDQATGAIRWKQPSKGSEKEGGAARYYSPADCPPCFAQGAVAAADRAYWLTLLEPLSGARLLAEQNCSAVCASTDGQFLYLRHTDGRVSKRWANGTPIWETRVPTGYIAAPPALGDGRIWVLSDRGMLSVLDEETGRVLAQWRAFRDQFCFASPAPEGQRVYLADMAGNVLALELGSG